MGDSIRGACCTAPKALIRSTAERFAADYVRLLQEISTDPHIALGALTLPFGTRSLDPAVIALIAELEARDVQMSLENDKLRLNAPKGALDDALKTRLSTHRDGLLAALRATGEADSKTGGIPPLPEGRRPELSFAQRRLWFMEQMDPGSVRYNIGCGIRLTGKVDTENLRLALEDVFARHEAFRTQITTEQGAAAGKDPGMLPRPHRDHRSVGDATRRARWVASAACATLVGAPLDLAGGVVARAHIIALAPDDHLLALSMHHIVSDGWSIAIIFRDIRSAYDARMTGAAPNLIPPRVRYVDFAAWEKARAAAHGFDGVGLLAPRTGGGPTAARPALRPSEAPERLGAWRACAYLHR